MLVITKKQFTMKKYILFLLIVLTQLPGFAQERHLRKAMENGRERGNYYVLRNDKKKMIRLDKLKSYCSRNGWLMGNYKSKSIVRFGDVSSTVSYFEFLPKNEFQDYIIENMLSRSKCSELRSRGTVFLFNNNPDNILTRKDNAIWSGQVNNGMIQGNGEGAIVEGNEIITFSGTFQNGFPTGIVIFKSNSRWRSSNHYSSGDVKNWQSNAGTLSDGMLWMVVNGKYGYVDSNGKTVIKPAYEKAQSFSNGYATVSLGKANFKINKSGQLLELTNSKQLSVEDMANLSNSYSNIKLIQDQVTKYASQAKSFEELLSLEKKFTKFDFTKYKKSYYDKDKSVVKEFYNIMVNSIKNKENGFNGKFEIPQAVTAFGKKYEQYDPEKWAKCTKLFVYYKDVDLCSRKPHDQNISELKTAYNSANSALSILKDLSSNQGEKETVSNYFRSNGATYINRAQSLERLAKERKIFAELQAQKNNNNNNNKSNTQNRRITLDDINTSNISSYIISSSSRYETRIDYEESDDYDEYDYFFGTDYDEIEYSVKVYDIKMKDYNGNGSFNVTIEYDTYNGGSYPYTFIGTQYGYKSYEACLLAVYRRHYGRD